MRFERKTGCTLRLACSFRAFILRIEHEILGALFLRKQTDPSKSVVYVFLLHFYHIGKNIFENINAFHSEIGGKQCGIIMYLMCTYYVLSLYFDRAGKIFFVGERSSEYMVMFEKTPRGYCLRRIDLAAGLNRLHNASPRLLLRLSIDEFLRDPESEVISLIFSSA